MDRIGGRRPTTVVLERTGTVWALSAVAVLWVVPRTATALYVQVKLALTASVVGMTQWAATRSTRLSVRVTELAVELPMLVTVIRYQTVLPLVHRHVRAERTRGAGGPRPC